MAAGLTKTALVRLLAEKLETSNKAAGLFLTTLAEIAVKETKKNDVFVLPGLGRLNRRASQDPCQDRSEVLRWQGRKRCNRSGKEGKVVSGWLRKAGPLRVGLFNLARRPVALKRLH
jgi:hypothetical protein